MFKRERERLFQGIRQNLLMLDRGKLLTIVI